MQSLWYDDSTDDLKTNNSVSAINAVFGIMRAVQREVGLSGMKSFFVTIALIEWVLYPHIFVL